MSFQVLRLGHDRSSQWKPARPTASPADVRVSPALDEEHLLAGRVHQGCQAALVRGRPAAGLLRVPKVRSHLPVDDDPIEFDLIGLSCFTSLSDQSNAPLIQQQPRVQISAEIFSSKIFFSKML